MIRLFRTHDIRKLKDLEGMWDFAKAEDGETVPPSSYDYRLPVPGCWESHPDLATYQGAGWFRTRIRTDRTANLRLVFKGVSHTARVFFDGEPIGEHYNAYTPFSVIAPKAAAGDHEIAVWVDNGFSERSSLHIPNDYYTYGGIIRPVALEEVPDLFVERVHFTPYRLEDGWEAELRATLRNLSDGPLPYGLTAELGGQSFEIGEGAAAPGETVRALTVRVPGAEAWSHEHPRLYELRCRLTGGVDTDPIDDWIDRVGFREIRVQGGKLSLNGKELFLKGYCRHEDHPMVGSSFPLQLMAQDLDLIQASGANAVRTTHYPYDERFLDLCDERGIYIWEENHARGLELGAMEHPLFDRQCEDCNREMVENHYNHPSIVVWGILNECASHTETGRAKYKKQIEQIRAMDGSRPITFATHHHFADLCLDLADIVSFNVYPGWYIDEEPGDYSDKLRAWADGAGGAGKPMILSEFGADGYYGLRTPMRVKGSEERQADIIRANLSAYRERPYLSGTFIWQFSDCRVTESNGWLLNRAGTKNSKGIVDGYRRPKLAYDTVREFYREGWRS